MKNKNQISKEVEQIFKNAKLFWMEVFLSAVIATLGLLQNSIAIVIGAMLIAPLLRPIQAIAFSIVRGQTKNIYRATKVMLGAIFLSILIAFLFASILPLKNETPEILARTTPNLIDLIVALASAVVVFATIKTNRFIESVAGVAMATSLLPPLAVCGIELALWHPDQVFGSLFLFVTNLLAIIFVGIVTFIAYGFSPKQRVKEVGIVKYLALIVTLIVLITFPLAASLKLIADKISTESKAQTYLENIISQKIPGASLTELKLLDITTQSAKFAAVIRIPSDEEFFLETQNAITNELGKTLNRDVNLSVQVVPITSIISKEEKAKMSELPIEEQLTSEFQEFLKAELPTSSLISLDVLPIAQGQWLLKPVVALTPSENLDLEKQNLLTQKFLKINQSAQSVNWGIIQLSEVKSKSELSLSELYQQEQYAKWQNFFATALPKQATVNNLQISWDVAPGFTEYEFNKDLITLYRASFDIYLPEDLLSQEDNIKEQVNNFANLLSNNSNQVSIRFFPYKRVELLNANN